MPLCCHWSCALLRCSSLQLLKARLHKDLFAVTCSGWLLSIYCISFGWFWSIYSSWEMISSTWQSLLKAGQIELEARSFAETQFLKTTTGAVGYGHKDTSSKLHGGIWKLFGFHLLWSLSKLMLTPLLIRTISRVQRVLWLQIARKDSLLLVIQKSLKFQILSLLLRISRPSHRCASLLLSRGEEAISGTRFFTFAFRMQREPKPLIMHAVQSVRPTVVWAMHQPQAIDSFLQLGPMHALRPFPSHATV